MRKFTILITVVAAMALAISCGSDSGTGPVPDPPGGGGGTIPQPNPAGVLLDGDAAAPARGATEPLPPSPADAGDVKNGLLSTRLIAAVAPGATVGAVNAALDAQGARIVSMNEGELFVTLKIPSAADEAAARTVADALVASGAFGYAAPAFVATTDAVSYEGGNGPQRTLPPGGDTEIGHLLAMNFQSAWNVSELAAITNEEIPVIVPDEYLLNLPHDEIDAQSMDGWGASNPLPGAEVYPGNHGYAVSGIIGANFDDTPVTGTSPDPSQLLDISSLPIGGLTWYDITWLMGWHVGTSGNRFVVNTSIGWNDPAFLVYSRIDRAMQVIAWRTTAAIHYHKFVHVTSAGSGGGDSRLNSIFTAAHYYDDVRDIVYEGNASAADSATIEAFWQDVLDTYPLASALQNNVIVVGSSAADGGESTFSNSPYHVRALGEGVAGPCRQEDPAYGTNNALCDGNVSHYSGTSMAAPQITGLAAYLMNLRDDKSPQQVRQIIIDNYIPAIGTVDAWGAVLDLDNGLNDAPVRRALLDVTGVPPQLSLNHKFDQFDAMQLADSVMQTRSTSRYDLNGDGWVGNKQIPFDVNADGALSVLQFPSINGIQNVLDENHVNDIELLCYLMHTGLYQGTLEGRDYALNRMLYFSCPYVDLAVDADNHSSSSERDEDEYLSKLFPAQVTASVTGVTALASAEGRTGRAKVTVTSPSDQSERDANAESRFWDRIYIDGPGLTGTDGTITLRVKVNGTFTVTGACADDRHDATGRWRFTFGYQNDVYGEKNDCGDFEGNTLPQTMELTVNFTYGNPIYFNLDLDCSGGAEPGNVTVDVNWDWLGIEGVPANATVRSCSGIDWGPFSPSVPGASVALSDQV